MSELEDGDDIIIEYSARRVQIKKYLQPWCIKYTDENLEQRG